MSACAQHIACEVALLLGHLHYCNVQLLSKMHQQTVRIILAMLIYLQSKDLLILILRIHQSSCFAMSSLDPTLSLQNVWVVPYLVTLMSKLFYCCFNLFLFSVFTFLPKLCLLLQNLMSHLIGNSVHC